MTSYYVDVFLMILNYLMRLAFTKIKDTYYLVTNWHIVSGRNADTKECLNKMGSVPNKLRVYVPKEDDNSTISYCDNFYMDVELLDQDGNKMHL